MRITATQICNTWLCISSENRRQDLVQCFYRRLRAFVSACSLWFFLFLYLVQSYSPADQNIKHDAKQVGGGGQRVCEDQVLNCRMEENECMLRVCVAVLSTPESLICCSAVKGNHFSSFLFFCCVLGATHSDKLTFLHAANQDTRPASIMFLVRYLSVYDCKINYYSIPHKSLYVIIMSSRCSGGKEKNWPRRTGQAARRQSHVHLRYTLELSVYRNSGCISNQMAKKDSCVSTLNQLVIKLPRKVPVWCDICAGVRVNKIVCALGT